MGVSICTEKHSTPSFSARNIEHTLLWLGYTEDEIYDHGDFRPHVSEELIVRVEAKLASGEVDPELADEHPAPNLIVCGRPAGYLREIAKLMLEVARTGPEVMFL